MESNSPQDGKHLTPDKESSVPEGEQFDSTRKSNTLQTAKLLLFGICMGVVLSMLLYPVSYTHLTLPTIYSV